MQIDTSLLYLMLLTHFLADFQFQPETLAQKKTTQFIYVIYHLMIVLASTMSICLFYPKAFVLAIMTFVSHVVIDLVKFIISPSLKLHEYPAQIFVADQLLHIVSIIWLVNQNEIVIGSIPQFIKTILFFCIITKPINILFKLGFKKAQVASTKPSNRAGYIIGSLERTLVGILLLFGQFPSIGLVFTAKSIARFNKIAESQEFAEYYLIGSLFSLISVLVVYVLLYQAASFF